MQQTRSMNLKSTIGTFVSAAEFYMRVMSLIAAG